MRRALLVHEHLDCGVVLHEQAGDTSVIQMNVREQNRLDVLDGNPLPREVAAQRVSAGAWTGVDEGDAGGACVDAGRDRARGVAEIQIDEGNI